MIYLSDMIAGFVSLFLPEFIYKHLDINFNCHFPLYTHRHTLHCFLHTHFIVTTWTLNTTKSLDGTIDRHEDNFVGIFFNDFLCTNRPFASVHLTASAPFEGEDIKRRTTATEKESIIIMMMADNRYRGVRSLCRSRAGPGKPRRRRECSSDAASIDHLTLATPQRQHTTTARGRGAHFRNA